MDKKKLAAAIAAVSAYIKTSEESSAYYASQALVSSGAEQIATQPQQHSIWGISGRQTQMQANSMMQLRMFK
jgi:hypothetical protein